MEMRPLTRGISAVIILFHVTSISYTSGRFIEASSSVNLLSCACNTQECRSQGTNRCMATNMCYVQYVPPTKRNRSAQRAKKDNYIRGCINRSTPLLCENRPPALSGKLQSEWPILHCCSSEMCNKNVLPTLPAWLPTSTVRPYIQEKDRQLDDTTTNQPDDAIIEPEDQDSLLSASSGPVDAEAAFDQASVRKTPAKPDQASEDDSQTRILIPSLSSVTDSDSIFPGTSSKLLYIGVPVVCVVLLIMLIIISVMALRRVQYVSTENLVAPPKSCGHADSLHSLKKKYPSPVKPGVGHDHVNVSCISGSPLSDERFHQNQPYFTYQSNRHF